MAKKNAHSSRAFTLLEMMASCAVFGILTALILQIFTVVSGSTSLSQRQMEILKQAIGAVERVQFDLLGSVRTGDARWWVVKDDANSGSDALYFVAPVAASLQPTKARGLSLVRFGIAPPPAQAPVVNGWPSADGFSRTVSPLTWDDDLSALFAQAAPSLSDGQVQQQIAPGVIRYEICFLLWDGTIVTAPPADEKTVRALICGVVAIDRQAASLLTATQRSDLLSRFPSPATGQRPLDVWKDTLQDFPLPVRQTLRIYEQTISI